MIKYSLLMEEQAHQMEEGEEPQQSRLPQEEEAQQ